MKSLVVFVALLVAVLAEQTRYDGYKVYKIVPKTEHELKVIKMFATYTDFDFWTQQGFVGQDVDVMVPPVAQKAFEIVLTANRIDYSIFIDDVETTFAAERQRQAVATKAEKGKIGFTEYYRYDDIQDYLGELSKTYSDIVSLEDFATSTEGRTITMLKISTGGEGKPAILIEGGIHAREWISPALVLYMIKQLVENEDNRRLIETTDWHIVPVINPDGYEYSHTSTRLWRKTRRIGTSCDGVDGNRNFNFQWMLTGASGNECSETYAGPTPQSEPEIAALSEYVLRQGNIFKLHLSIHSYGQYILYPWGYTSAYPDDAEELQALGAKVAATIKSVNNKTYTVGSSNNALYANSGSSVDWTKGVAGIQIGYTLELPGGGSAGFDLPASRIVEVVEETWEGIVVFQEYIANKFASKIYV